MKEHLGMEKYGRNCEDDKNYRIGHSLKNIKTSFGEVMVLTMNGKLR